MKIEDCRVGMKVRAVRKTVSDSSWGSFCRRYPNQISRISDIRGNKCHPDSGSSYVLVGDTWPLSYYFDPSDLESVEQLWVCDHGKTCQNERAVCREPRTADKMFSGLFKDSKGWHCEYHNTGNSTPDDSVLVKAIPYKEEAVPITYAPYNFQSSPINLSSPKEATMPKEYESLKPITLLAMREAGACNSQRFRDFIIKTINAGLQWDDEIPVHLAMRWAKTDFLVTKGFVRETVKKCLVFTIVDYDPYQYTVKCDGLHVANFYKDGRGCELIGSCGTSTFETDAQGRIKVVE